MADELHIPQHVLRFWETKFPQVKPLKRGGGRRYYRPDDIALLRRISDLLYIQGYTIKGVQRLLREGGGRLSDDIPPAPEDEQEAAEAERTARVVRGTRAARTAVRRDLATGPRHPLASQGRSGGRAAADGADGDPARTGGAPGAPGLTGYGRCHPATDCPLRLFGPFHTFRFGKSRYTRAGDGKS